MKAAKKSKSEEECGCGECDECIQNHPMHSTMKQTGGPIIFIIGFAVAIMAALFFPGKAEFYSFVALMGIAVGLVNIKEDEVHGFLLATIAFGVSAAGLVTVFQTLHVADTTTALGYLVSVFVNAIGPFANYVVAFISPAAAVVALKQIIMLAKDY